MSPTTAMPPDEAATTLANIRSTREQTRGDLQAYWFAIVVFGLLTLLSTPFFAIWDGAALGLFWLVAAPAGVFAVIRHERSIGVTRAARPYMITASCLVAACFALGAGGGIADEPDIASFGPALAIAVAYLVFAWLERSVALALLALSLGALTAGLAVADVDGAGQFLALAYGASFVTLGLLARTWPTTRR